MSAFRIAMLALSLAQSAAPPRLHAATVGPPVAVAQPVAVGWAFEYKPGVMAAVARVRHMSLMPGVAYISMMRCDTLGRLWRLSIAGEAVTGQQVDCSNPIDLAMQRRMGLIVEVNYQLAHDQGWSIYNGDKGAGRARAVIWGLMPR